MHPTCKQHTLLCKFSQSEHPLFMTLVINQVPHVCQLPTSKLTQDSFYYSTNLCIIGNITFFFNEITLGISPKMSFKSEMHAATCSWVDALLFMQSFNLCLLFFGHGFFTYLGYSSCFSFTVNEAILCITCCLLVLLIHTDCTLLLFFVIILQRNSTVVLNSLPNFSDLTQTTLIATSNLTLPIP